MKLSELLLRHPHVTLATVAHNEDILAFFYSLPMEGKGLDLQYDRSPDFFAFLKFHSQDYFIFLLQDKEKIQGVGTLILKPGFINKTETIIGYLGDLRVKPGLRNAFNWRNFYNDLIQNSTSIDELKGVKYFQTVVIDSNFQAKNSLVHSTKNAFQYNLLAPYFMINIYGKKPWKKTHQTIEVRRGEPKDALLIENFWREEEQKKQFGAPGMLAYALTHWKKFNYENIIIAIDDGKITGMCGLWNPSPTKRIIIKKYPLSLLLLTFLLRLRKRSFPKENEELKPLYLTHLHFTNPEVLGEMIQFILKLPETLNYHVVSFAGFPQEKITEGLKSFLYEAVPMSYYQVYKSDDNQLKLGPLSNAPGFEMSLV